MYGLFTVISGLHVRIGTIHICMPTPDTINGRNNRWYVITTYIRRGQKPYATYTNVYVYESPARSQLMYDHKLLQSGRLYGQAL